MREKASRTWIEQRHGPDVARGPQVGHHHSIEFKHFTTLSFLFSPAFLVSFPGYSRFTYSPLPLMSHYHIDRNKSSPFIFYDFHLPGFISLQFFPSFQMPYLTLTFCNIRHPPFFPRSLSTRSCVISPLHASLFRSRHSHHF